jgi:bifunctional DNA-binding transcriptional regulator/antitoxin component of YhaV-PrlF toxin-antitoxin module
MKDEKEILQMDARGRLVIPGKIRRKLALDAESPIMMICDLDSKSIRILPLATPDTGKEFVSFHIRMRDNAGSLAQIAQVFSRLGISMLYDQASVTNKGKDAEWHVIAALDEKELDLVVTELRQSSAAIDVTYSKS